MTRNDNNGNYNITENDEAIMESCDDATSAADACKIEIVTKTFFKCHCDSKLRRKYTNILREKTDYVTPRGISLAETCGFCVTAVYR